MEAVTGSLSPRNAGFPGVFRVRGQVFMLSSRPDGYLTTRDAAKLAGVSPATIRQWRARGWLDKQGLDERGYPLHTAAAVRAAEQTVRENGLEASGVDPRQQRKPKAALGCPSCSSLTRRSSRTRSWWPSSARPRKNITLAAAVFGWLPDPEDRFRAV